jgi:hypothetical protein
VKPSALHRRRPRPWLGAGLATLAIVALTLGAGVLAAPPAAAAGSGVTLAAAIDGHSVAGSSSSHPVKLYPNRPAVIDILVTNYRTRTITVDTVSINGTVAGLTFYAYDTSVHLLLGSHRATHLRYALDLTGLDGQATGLIPATISIANPRHQQLASQSMVTDVQGSLDSVYGLFGLALLVLTALAIIGVVVSIATHRMPPNRWRRGLRMLTPGIGLALVLVFSMSALSVWVPTPGTWLTVVLVFAVVFFVLGYLTPNPTVEGEDDEDDDDLYLSATPESQPAEAPPPPPAAATASGTSTLGDESSA